MRNLSQCRMLSGAKILYCIVFTMLVVFYLGVVLLSTTEQQQRRVHSLVPELQESEQSNPLDLGHHMVDTDIIQRYTIATDLETEIWHNATDPRVTIGYIAGVDNSDDAVIQDKQTLKEFVRLTKDNVYLFDSSVIPFRNGKPYILGTDNHIKMTTCDVGIGYASVFKSNHVKRPGLVRKSRYTEFHNTPSYLQCTVH